MICEWTTYDIFEEDQPPVLTPSTFTTTTIPIIPQITQDQTNNSSNYITTSQLILPDNQNYESSITKTPRGTVTFTHLTEHHYLKAVRRAVNGVDEIYATIAPLDHQCIPNVCNIVREIPFLSYGKFTMKNESGSWEMPLTCASKQVIRTALHKIEQKIVQVD